MTKSIKQPSLPGHDSWEPLPHDAARHEFLSLGDEPAVGTLGASRTFETRFGPRIAMTFAVAEIFRDANGVTHEAGEVLDLVLSADLRRLQALQGRMIRIAELERDGTKRMYDVRVAP